jgi:hypothetical protein
MQNKEIIMKILKNLSVVLFTSLISTQSFADINFEFKHRPSEANRTLPSDVTPSLYISAQKGPHLAETSGSMSQNGIANDELVPGESSHDFTTSSLFAPDPTGTYEIKINCYLRYQGKKESMQSFSTTLSVPKMAALSKLKLLAL